MTMPGYDELLMKDRKFAFHDVVEKRYYSVNISAIGSASTVNHTARHFDTQGFKAVIDSGTSVIIGPSHIVTPLLEGISVNKDCSGIDQLPNILFTFDSVEYELEPADYVLKVSAFGLTECVMAFMPAELPAGFNYFILGDVFMRRYYTYFDKNNNRLGFYDARKLNVVQ